jgi:hypothetical protein
MSNREFDFWYALHNTEVIHPPSGRLETFGNTVVNYHLLCELMDTTNEVRIREGRIEAFRPQIITPGHMSQSPISGFGEEAHQYMNWLRDNADDLVLLRYGFQVQKEEVRHYTVHETLPVVIGQIEDEVQKINDPLSAIVIGVDQPWEVCLMKLMVDVMQKSVLANVQDLQRKNLLPMNPEQSEKMKRDEIEQDFRAASMDRSLIQDLGRKLQKYGLFADYEDRFFLLVRGR